MAQCFCGDDPDLTANGEQVDDSECNMDCTGSATGEEKCGASNRISVYEYVAGPDEDLNYIGCYGDDRFNRAMDGVTVLSSSQMTNTVSHGGQLSFPPFVTQFNRLKHVFEVRWHQRAC